MLGRKNQGTSVLDGVSNEDLLDLVNRAKADPFAAQQALQLQKKVYDAFQDVIQEALQVINDDEIQPDPKASKGMSVVALAAEAKKRTAHSNAKRELARDMAIGAVINMGNPDWDPMDPSTSVRNEGNGLLALMEMDLHPDQDQGQDELQH